MLPTPVPSVQKKVLQAHHLVIGYPNKKLMQGTELSLHGGSVTALLGPNGAGKSTLIRTLSGLHPPLSGEISIKGTAIDRLSRADLSKQISLVLTHKEPLGTMKVAELVALGRAPYTKWHGWMSKKDHESVSTALQWVGMLPFAGRTVDSLSDGERQKVMIARALAQDTPIMLLDEPTAHLDLANRLEVFQLMNHLAKQLQKTIVISTHELELALHYTDEIWLLNSHLGQLIQGLPEDLVLQGHIDEAFPSLNFQWEKASQHWLSPPHPAMRNSKIQISGEPLSCEWTAHALRRHGFEIIDSQATVNEAIQIQAAQEKWISKGTEYISIQQLLHGLTA